MKIIDAILALFVVPDRERFARAAAHVFPELTELATLRQELADTRRLASETQGRYRDALWKLQEQCSENVELVKERDALRARVAELEAAALLGGTKSDMGSGGPKERPIANAMRECGICRERNIPVGIDWSWWRAGRPVHPHCTANNHDPGSADT